MIGLVVVTFKCYACACYDLAALSTKPVRAAFCQRYSVSLAYLREIQCICTLGYTSY